MGPTWGREKEEEGQGLRGMRDGQGMA
jgi:hypothetical protein